MLLHVGFNAWFSLHVRRLAWADPDVLDSFPIGHLAAEDEVGESYFLAGDRGLDWSLWHRWLLNSLVFIDFYRRKKPFEQPFRRFLVPSMPFGPGRIDVRELAKPLESRFISKAVHQFAGTDLVPEISFC